MKTFAPKHLVMALVLFLTLIPAAVCGAQETQENTKPWQDEAELSFVQTGGNTDIVTFAGKNTLKYQIAPQWAGTWVLGALYGETDGDKAAERYFTDLRIDYAFSERLYFYGMAGWSQDKFAGIDNRIYLGPGAGYHILTGEYHFLLVEAGLSYAAEEYTNGIEDDFLEGRLFGKYTFVFNPKTKASQSLEYLHNFSDAERFHVNAVTDLTTMITDIISIKLSYEIRYANEPIPASLDETDTVFKAAIVVSL